MGDHVSQFAGNAPLSGEQLTVLDNAAANTGAIGQAKKIPVLFTGAKTGFSQSSGVGIVQNKHRPPYRFPENLPHGEIYGSEAGPVMPGQYALGFVVDLSGHGHGQNIVIVIGFRNSDGFFRQNFHRADPGGCQPLAGQRTVLFQDC